MVLKMHKNSVSKEDYVIDDDLVVKQRSVNLASDLETFSDIEKNCF